MKARLAGSLFSIAVAVLLLVGCDDSKNPLSNPQTSKPDARLAGLWRQQDTSGNTNFYHIGRAGESLPEGVMRVISAAHSGDGELHEPGQLLIFPTTLAGATYLNVTDGNKQQVKLIEEQGWKGVDSYILLKYKVDGDTLLVWPTDGDAKKKAIESGKVKGLVEKQDSGTKVVFTDTTENLARFFAGAADSLFAKEPIRLERVK